MASGDDPSTRLSTPPRAEGESAIRKHVHAALFGGPKPVDVTRDGVPAAVGRFRTTRVLGSGGMGTVLAGYDDELERPVAVKLLHREIGVQHAERLRREAKALAKLSHPNVVTVYEVGTHQDRLFIAMEQVEGVTLGTWMRAEEHSLDALLDVFLQTGQGLVAAHARGLIHRDFKPDNVIVGEDGRPRILDFGLVHAADEEESDDAIHAPASPPEDMALAETGPGDTPQAGSGSLTETGTVLGTPAYMPWEQLRGAQTTEASDQFAFCVSLWEALYGARPFPGRTVVTLAEAVSTGKVEPPKRSRGSGRLRRALERGLSPKPQGRWPGMQALLEELSDIRTASTRKRRSAVVVGALTLALGGTAWGLTRPGRPGCEPAQERLAGIWDDEVKQTVADRFVGASARVQEFYVKERALLDDWANTWSEIHTQTCASDEETVNRLRYAQRQTCLDQRLLELRVRAVAMTDLTPEVAATAASGDYMPFYFPRDCRNPKLVEGIVQYPDGPLRQKLLDALLKLRTLEQLAKATFFGEPGLEYESVLDREIEVLNEIEEIGYLPAVADVRTRSANAMLMGGIVPFDEAVAQIDDAALLATEARSDQTYVLGRLWKLWGLKERGSDAYYGPEIVAQLPTWEAALARNGWPIYGTLEFRAWQGAILSMSGDVKAGRIAAEAGVAFARETFGTDHMFYRRALQTTAHYLRGTPLENLGRGYRQEMLERTESAVGPNALELVMPLGGETEDLTNEEKFDAALTMARRTLSLSTLHHGESGANTTYAQVGLARVHAARGEFAEVDALLPKIWGSLEHDSGIFIAVPAELQVHYSAARGEPDPVALANLGKVGAVHDFTKRIIAVATPLLDGRPTDEALAAVDEAMKLDESPAPQAIAHLVRGHLFERDGRLREAAEAFGKSAECDCVAINGAMVLYAARLGQVRTLRQLGDLSAEPIAQAFRKRLLRTSSSTRLVDALDQSASR